MSLAEDSAATPIERSAVPPVDLIRGASLYRLPAYAACAALALVVNYLLGKEMAWDTLVYHLYTGFSALHDRFAQDYFPTGIHSYLNPYAYVPFYALATSGLSALQASSLLALLHAVILCLTFELALVVFPSGTPGQRWGMAVCAVAMAAVNPILLQQLGTSFTDITTGELVLAGWLLLAGSVRAAGPARIIFAAALLGAATALKPTNAVHSVAAAVILVMLPQPAARRIKYLSAYGCALGVSFAIVAAPWSYRLARAFGNPFFPLLNNVFRSPEFVTAPLRHFRFIPSSLAEALWRPFAILDPAPMIHEEIAAPDPRYAVLLVLAGVLLVQWLWRRYRPVNTAATTDSPIDVRVLTALGCAFAADWIAWLAASGNSRYFLPIACVAGVLLVGVLFLVLANRARVRNYLLAAIFATQLVQLCVGADLRWKSGAWNGGPWFDVQVPDKLARERALYLSLGANAFIAPYLAPDAGLMSFTGDYPFGLSGANGAKAAALIRKYAPHLRVLWQSARPYPDAVRQTPGISIVAGAVRRFGLRAQTTDCATITVHGLPPDTELRTTSTPPASDMHDSSDSNSGTADTSYLVSCELIPDHTDHSSALAGQREAEIVLDRLEEACPQLFQPRGPPLDNWGGTWQRYYFNTELIAWLSHGEVKFMDPWHDDSAVLGRESDWLRAPQRMVCGRRGRHYFAKVLGPAPAN
jgi:Glycosyltransferase family 87